VGEASLPPLRIGSHQAPVIPDVLQEHLEEVAFLSIQRRKLLFSPELPLHRFLPHDGRIAAHWDALVLGGEASVQIALEKLEEFDPWEVYAAARVWLELGTPKTEEITQRLEAVEDDLLPAWREALSRMTGDRLAELLPPEGLADSATKVQSVLAYAWGWRGILPEDLAASFAFSSDPRVRRSTARALGWGAMPAHASKLLPALLTDPEPDVNRAALWSQALLDPGSAAAIARTHLAAEAPSPFSIRILGLLGTSPDVEFLADLVGADEVGLASVRAMGDLGSPAAVDLLIDLLTDENEELAGAAREAIEMILGSVPVPSEEGEDPALEEAEEPSPEQVKAVWAEMAPSYGRADRWLRGQPSTWEGPKDQEPMEVIWRSGLFAVRQETPWLRNEVPDGFFAAGPDFEAVPGE